MSSPSETAAAPGRRLLRFALFVLLVVALISLPFVLFGESFALPLLRSHEDRVWAMILVALGLLTADAVSPVPSAVVIVVLAARTTWWIGALVGTLGLTGQVLCAAWLGRTAGGRLAPRFFPAPELARLRGTLQQKLALTLGCLRCVPVFSETSVVVAASFGIPIRRIVWVTLAPNAAMSVIYSLAIGDSLATACFAFVASVAASYGIWRLYGASIAADREPAGRNGARASVLARPAPAVSLDRMEPVRLNNTAADDRPAGSDRSAVS